MIRTWLFVAVAGMLLSTSGCIEATPFSGGDGHDVVADGPDVVADAPIVCTPECETRECGDDGCGGTCGSCPAVAPYCTSGLCSATCAPDCADKECGDDGCGGSCGQCPEAAPICTETFKCIPSDCDPKCDGRVCGDDGCGGSCGTCQDDGLACNGVESCDDLAGLCVSDGGLDCDDDDVCTEDACEEVNSEGVCVHPPALGAGDCDDDDACTQADHCEDGLCVGTEMDCDDGDDCTFDSCDSEVASEDLCIHDPLNETDCDDSDPCTTDDACVLGECAGLTKNCDDGDACNGLETCNPDDGECAAGETLACDPGAACDDEVGGCAWHETSQCDDEGYCLLVSDDDMALGMSDGDSGDDILIGDGDADNMQVGLQIEVNEDGEPISFFVAYSIISFDSAWGIGIPDKPAHRIHATVYLWPTPESPEMNEADLSLFSVLLLSGKLSETDDSNLQEAMAGIGAKFISSGPPTVSEDPQTGETVWAFPIELEPDQVSDVIFKSIAIAVNLQILGNGGLGDAPGLASFYTKESVGTVTPNLIPRILLDYNVCAPTCNNKACGTDGCGGACGDACTDGSTCVELETTSFCCADKPCVDDAICGTTPCGVACSEGGGNSGYLCVEGQEDTGGWSGVCEDSGCDIYANLDISRSHNVDWNDGEPIIPLFETEGESFGASYEALIYFPWMMNKIDSESESTQGQTIYLKLWFAHDVGASGGPQLQFETPGLWHSDGSVSSLTLAAGQAEEESTDFQSYWLGASSPIDVADDGGFVYALEGVQVDSGNTVTQALATNGIRIGVDWDSADLVLLRSTESGFGPQLTWKPFSCAQACTGKACGPDGCGGTCGECGGGTVCDGTLGTGTYECMKPVCPPGELKCVGADLTRCNDLGTSYVLETLCTQELLTCQDEGGVGDLACGQNPLASSSALSLGADGDPIAVTVSHPALQATQGEQNDDAFTISLWLYTEAATDGRVLASYGGTSGSAYYSTESTGCNMDESGWVLYIADGRLRFKTADVVSKVARISSTGPAWAGTAGQWVHIAVVSTGAPGAKAHTEGSVRLYVNGVDRWSQWEEHVIEGGKEWAEYGGMSPIDHGWITYPGFILGDEGCHSNQDVASNTKGVFDELAIYGIDLNHDEVVALFGGGCGASPQTVAPDHLILWWRFGETPGDGEVVKTNGQITNHPDTPLGDALDGKIIGLEFVMFDSSWVDPSCAEPGTCSAPGACGPGCGPCEEGTICGGLGWCVTPSCLEPPDPVPAATQGCSGACGTGLSGCGMTAFCGYGCGYGTCDNDVAEAVAALPGGGFVTAGRTCTNGPCQVAVWTFTEDGALQNEMVYVDLGGESYAYADQSQLDERALAVDVAHDGSGKIFIAGWSAVSEANFLGGEPHRRPMVAQLNSDLSVAWVYVDQDHLGAFTDVKLNSVSFQYWSGTANENATPYSTAFAVGYHEEVHWKSTGGVFLKKGGLFRPVHTVEGIPLPGNAYTDNPPNPTDPSAPGISEGAWYTGIDRSNDGDFYLVRTKESESYAPLDSVLTKVSLQDGCCWPDELVDSSPTKDIQYRDVATASSAAWPDGKERIYVAVSQAALGKAPELLVRRYVADPSWESGSFVELEGEAVISSYGEQPMDVHAICASGDLGIVLAGSILTPYGDRRPAIERRTALVTGVHWTHLVNYKAQASGALTQPGTTWDAIRDCAISKVGEGHRLMAVGDLVQPGQSQVLAPLHDAYISTHDWGTGKSSCF